MVKGKNFTAQGIHNNSGLLFVNQFNTCIDNVMLFKKTL